MTRVHRLGVIITIIILTIVTITPYGLANVANAENVNPEWLDFRLVTQANMGIIPVAVNSPYNGEASVEMTNSFWWEFGSLVSARQETSYTLALTLQNGASAALVEAWKVSVYDVYDCFLWWCSYLGRMAAAEQRLPGVFVWEYEHAGDMVDNTIPVVKTYECSPSGCNRVGSHWFDATYRNMDDYVVMSPGSTCLTRQVTKANSLDFSVSIGLSVRFVSLDGIAHGGFGSSSVNKVTYKFCSLPDRAVINLIDYKGPYDLTSNKYPLIWAFYAYTSSSTPSAEEIMDFASKVVVEPEFNILSIGVDESGMLEWTESSSLDIEGVVVEVDPVYSTIEVGVGSDGSIMWTRPETVVING